MEPIVIPVAENFKDVCELISSDYYRITEKTLSTFGCIVQLLKGDYLAWFRLIQIKSIFLPFFKRIYRHYTKKACVDMGWTTKIGYGFYGGHRQCIVISGHTIIGNNVSISQFTNIGTNKGKAAMICDGAYLAPMVCTVEDVTIGKQAVVGAGAVVVKDVPSFTTVGGVPAKKISDNYRKEWHAYPLPEALLTKMKEGESPENLG